MKMKVRGHTLKIEKKEVEEVAKRIYKSDGKTRYMVVINNRQIPAKRLFYELVKIKGIPLTLQDITTKDAVYAFRRMGFEVIDRGEKGTLLELAGSLAMGGNAVEDERELYPS